jgi:hypothetical protein
MFIPQIRVLTCTHCVSYCNLHNALISSQVALAVHDDELLRLYQVRDDLSILGVDGFRNSFVRMCCFLHLHLGVIRPWICIDGSSHCRVDCRASAFFFSRELEILSYSLMVLKCLKCTWARGRRYHIEILEHLYQSVVWKPLLLVVSSAKRSVRSTVASSYHRCPLGKT